MVTPRVSNVLPSIHQADDLTRDMLVDLLSHCPHLLRDAEEIADDYLKNTDHGFSHSKDVYARCLTLIDQSPNLVRFANQCHNISESIMKDVLLTASLFHDISRFWGAGFEDHERESADFLKYIMPTKTIVYDLVYRCIIHHDYFNFIVNGTSLPFEAMNPLSEIFRLADCTSLSPAQELKRYYETGLRVAPNMSLFDGSLSDEIRFDFQNPDGRSRDYLTWFLIMFSMQSTDFLYAETADAYAYWARGKKQAIVDLEAWCLAQEYVDLKPPVDPQEVKQVIERFAKQFNLIVST